MKNVQFFIQLIKLPHLREVKICARIAGLSRGRATVARQAHNLKIAGSIPAPATSCTPYHHPKNDPNQWVIESNTLAVVVDVAKAAEVDCVQVLVALSRMDPVAHE